MLVIAHQNAMEGTDMGSRRGRSTFSRQHPVVYVIALILLALSGYFGKDSLPPEWTAWLPSAPAPAQSQSAAKPTEPVKEGGEILVERVVDGDTLVVTGGERIRLLGVDTPETKHPNKPPEPFGKEAYEFTRRTVEGKRVQLKFDPKESKDKYGRTLAYVYVDGQFLNETLIRRGLARALTNYPFSAEMKQVFRGAEDAAKSERVGIWSSGVPRTDLSRDPKRQAG